MNLYLLIILALGIVFGIWMGRKSSGKVQSEPFDSAQGERLRGLQDEAREAVERRTVERKEKILEFMKKEAEHLGELQLCGIDTTRKEFEREDVEKLLDVSPNTALKYLNELEAEGKVQQVGKMGPGVYYTLKNY